MSGYTDQEILRAVKTIASKHGDIKTSRFGGDYPSRGAVERRYDSVNIAAGVAGVEDDLVGYYQCHSCGGLYRQLGKHVSQHKDCSYPKISDDNKEMFKGLLMGDGCIGNRDGVPYFVVSFSGNERAIDHIKQKVNIPCRKDVRETEDENHRTIYVCRTLAHTWFSELSSWYSSGEKRYPNSIQLTPTVLKMWYVTDGGFNTNPRITCWNESSRKEMIIEKFNDIGIDANWRQSNKTVSIVGEDVEYFFEYMGEPLPGFEYKWPDRYK